MSEAKPRALVDQVLCSRLGARAARTATASAISFDQGCITHNQQRGRHTYSHAYVQRCPGLSCTLESPSPRSSRIPGHSRRQHKEAFRSIHSATVDPCGRGSSILEREEQAKCSSVAAAAAAASHLAAATPSNDCLSRLDQRQASDRRRPLGVTIRSVYRSEAFCARSGAESKRRAKRRARSAFSLPPAPLLLRGSVRAGGQFA